MIPLAARCFVTLTLESSIHIPLPIANNVLSPHTENTRGMKPGPTNSVCAKSNMALLHPSSCHSLVAVGMLQIYATRGLLQCSPRSGTSHTATQKQFMVLLNHNCGNYYIHIYSMEVKFLTWKKCSLTGL